jgi:hypothetical protein
MLQVTYKHVTLNGFYKFGLRFLFLRHQLLRKNAYTILLERLKSRIQIFKWNLYLTSCQISVEDFECLCLPSPRWTNDSVARKHQDIQEEKRHVINDV